MPACWLPLAPSAIPVVLLPGESSVTVHCASAWLARAAASAKNIVRNNALLLYNESRLYPTRAGVVGWVALVKGRGKSASCANWFRPYTSDWAPHPSSLRQIGPPPSPKCGAFETLVLWRH